MKKQLLASEVFFSMIGSKQCVQKIRLFWSLKAFSSSRIRMFPPTIGDLEEEGSLLLFVHNLAKMINKASLLSRLRSTSS